MTPTTHSPDLLARLHPAEATTMPDTDNIIVQLLRENAEGMHRLESKLDGLVTSHGDHKGQLDLMKQELEHQRELREAAQAAHATWKKAVDDQLEQLKEARQRTAGVLAVLGLIWAAATVGGGVYLTSYMSRQQQSQSALLQLQTLETLDRAGVHLPSGTIRVPPAPGSGQ